LLRQNDEPTETEEVSNIVYLPLKHTPTADTTVLKRLPFSGQILYKDFNLRSSYNDKKEEHLFT